VRSWVVRKREKPSERDNPNDRKKSHNRGRQITQEKSTGTKSIQKISLVVRKLALGYQSPTKRPKKNVKGEPYKRTSRKGADRRRGKITTTTRCSKIV